MLGQDEARDRLAAADKEKREMARIVRQDLDMDGSSDDQDEDGNDKYNQCGKEIKKRLALASKTAGSSSSEGVVPPRAAVVSTKVGVAPVKASSSSSSKEKVLVERNSGLRVKRPLVSSAQMDDAVRGRRVVRMSSVGEEARRGAIKDCDWLTIGVLFYKTEPKNSKSGKCKNHSRF